MMMIMIMMLLMAMATKITHLLAELFGVWTEMCFDKDDYGRDHDNGSDENWFAELF